MISFSSRTAITSLACIAMSFVLQASGARSQDGVNPQERAPSITDDEIKKIVLRFKERVKHAKGVELGKIGSTGTVKIALNSNLHKEAMEDLAECIPTKAPKQILRPSPGDTKPFARPFWQIQITEEGTLPTKDKISEVESSITSIVLEGKYFRFVMKDKAEIICDMDPEVEFDRSDAIWTLFGKLLVLSLR